VIVPAARPELLVGLRIAIGFGWITLVAMGILVIGGWPGASTP